MARVFHATHAIWTPDFIIACRTKDLTAIFASIAALFRFYPFLEITWQKFADHGICPLIRIIPA